MDITPELMVPSWEQMYLRGGLSGSLDTWILWLVTNTIRSNPRETTLFVRPCEGSVLVYQSASEVALPKHWQLSSSTTVFLAWAPICLACGTKGLDTHFSQLLLPGPMFPRVGVWEGKSLLCTGSALLWLQHWWWWCGALPASCPGTSALPVVIFASSVQEEHHGSHCHLGAVIFPGKWSGFTSWILEGSRVPSPWGSHTKFHVAPKQQ